MGRRPNMGAAITASTPPGLMVKHARGETLVIGTPARPAAGTGAKMVHSTPHLVVDRVEVRLARAAARLTSLVQVNTRAPVLQIERPVRRPARRQDFMYTDTYPHVDVRAMTLRWGTKPPSPR